MTIHPGAPTFSATDLSNFLGCSHLSLLDRQARNGGPKPPRFDDPGLEVLKQRGLEHERLYEERLVEEGLQVERIVKPEWRDGKDYWERFTAASLAALRAGPDVVVQAGLWDGSWVGKPDFLRRIGAAPPPATWVYDVVDTKLAREAKCGALLQILLYADLLERVHGAAPREIHLALGGPDARTESFRVADYAAYFRSIRGRFTEFHREGAAEPPLGPDPVAHCAICAWSSRCAEERRQLDHLSLVAGISRRQRRALVERGVHTLEALAGLASAPLSPPLEGIAAAAFDRVCQQARLQLEGRIGGKPVYELLPVEKEKGLAALPAPSPGDLFFDLEGNPYAFIHGIEYLFGYTDAEGEYTAKWALTREEEKRAFEEFIDTVMERLERHPDLHVYHYAPYEPTALKRLMSLHATREAEVDRLLRGGVLVDLYKVVRQGVRASVESYSIKRMEPFYGFPRDVDLRAANHALARFDAWLEMGMFHEENDARLRTVEGYNRDDSVSTLRLRDWLETLRAEAERASGAPIPRPAAPDAWAGEEQEQRQAEIAARMDALLLGVPANPEERTQEQHSRWILAQMLEFHRREKKSAWWEYFRCLELGEEEAIEDRATLGGLEYVGVIDTVKKSSVHRYRFPAQDHGIKSSDVRDAATGKSPGTLVAIDDVAGTVDLKRGTSSAVPHPRTLVPFDMLPDTVLRESIRRVADAAISHGLTPDCPLRCSVALLLRETPAVPRGPGGSLHLAGEAPFDAACRLVNELDGAVLTIQGPPGAGKTYTAAEMIVRAISAGRRVGITANSHKVIANLLRDVCRAAERNGVTVAGIQKGDGEQWCGEACVETTTDNAAVAAALADGTANLAAGTAWLWAREEMVGAVDLLFIDEAGQFSLANALAVAPAANSLVLLGDPRQLEQPQQGVHPPGAELSALDHLLGDQATVPEDRGLFLERTWRMHPSICAFTSEMFYDGRLESKELLERQAIRCPGPYGGSGLRFVPVPHVGNQSESSEEAVVIAGIVEGLTTGSWVDKDGAVARLTLDDILIVAPYNAQVAAIVEAVPGARAGTVDKFQGQQAPVVIYSLTTSSAADAPRGMEFLYSPNRLNVATSRARCLAVVVGSPALFSPECRTPAQMKLANVFCRLLELAEPCPAPA